MPNAIKWSSLSSFTTGIAGGSSSPTLKNLSSGSRKLGNEIDNTSGKNIFSDWELKITPASSPSAGAYVELYFIKALDGTNYEYGDDSTDPPNAALVNVFSVRATTTTHRVALSHVVLPACKFKPLIINRTGQAFSNVDDENILSYRTYNEEVQ
jgi:hypothetical protein